MVDSKLKVAHIQATNGRNKGKKIEVLFNPSEYTIEKGNKYQSTPIPGLATPVHQFVHGNSDTLTMELFFDTYARASRQGHVEQGEDVRKYTGKLAALMDMDPTIHAAPVCEFHWGGKVVIKGVIERLTQKFTMFQSDGIPVRATLNVTFKEYKPVTDQLKEIGRQSADRTKSKMIKEGDSLWVIAALEYGDPGLWHHIASKNKIDNPRLLETGKEILLPPLDELLE